LANSVRPTIALTILILMLSLGLDVVPRFALGDSGAYLGTEIGGYLPEDRSWLYGLMASRVIRLTRDLDTVAIGQILISWTSAVLLAHALMRYFRTAPWFGLLAVVALFANPLSFFWARFFMTDTLAAAMFASLAALLLESRGAIVTLSGVFVLAFAVASLRSIYMPPLLAAFGSVAALYLLRIIAAALRRGASTPAHRHAAIRYALLTATVGLATFSYAFVNSRVLGKPTISTNYAATRFMVSAWSPLMAPALAALDLPPHVTDHMVPLTYEARLATLFAPAGLVNRLSAHYGSFDAAAPAYKRLLHAAVFDSPLDFLALIARSWSDYVNPARVLLYHREMRLTGTNNRGTPDTLPPDLIARLQGWGIWQKIAPDLPQFPSFGARYCKYAGGYWVLLVSIHATLAGLLYLVLPLRNRTADVLALQLFAVAYIAMVAVTTNELVTRYLIPMDIPVLVTAAALLGNRATSQPTHALQRRMG